MKFQKYRIIKRIENKRAWYHVEERKWYIPIWKKISEQYPRKDLAKAFLNDQSK